MPINKNEILIGSIRPNLKVKATEYADSTFQALAEKISADYIAILKNCIVPTITNSSGLKMRELRVMACLYFYDTPLMPAHISAMLSYDPATVTRAVTCLVKAGMVSRVKNIHDTRSVVLTLTEKGLPLAALYAQRIKTTYATLETMIGESLSEKERMQFLTVLYKISKRTDDMRHYSKHLPDLNEDSDDAVPSDA